MLLKAIACHHAGRLADAERLYRSVLALDGRHPNALHGLGVLATQAAHYPEAVHLLQSAIALDDRQSTYFLNLGNALQLSGQRESAVAAYEQALKLSPGSASAHSNFGMTLLALNRPAEAIQHLTTAVQLQPASAQIRDNLGNALQSAGRLTEAVQHHRRALELIEPVQGPTPQSTEIEGNLGLALAAMGQWSEAMARFNHALGCQSQNPRIQLARAQLQLLLGDFESGLLHYEWRHRVHGQRSLPGKPWRGEPIESGDTLLLYAEQGLGDTLQMLRYLPSVQHRLRQGAQLILEVQQPVMRLAETLAGAIQVLSAGTPLPPTDWQSSLMSLPLIFTKLLGVSNPENTPAIPSTMPYLFTPEDANEPTASKSQAGLTTALNIGIAWSGNPSHVRDRFRSISPRMLNPLLHTEGCHFHSLQLDKTPPEIAGLVTDHRESLQDLADTAALIQQLDLIITVDTAVAHLAGALAKPVWTILPFWPDWRWGLGRQDTPWYPTMRLFRQPQPGQWQPVLKEVAIALSLQAQHRQRPQESQP